MRVREGWLRDLLRLVAWYPFRLVVERLPVRLALAIFRSLGDIHWLVAADRRRHLDRNLIRLGIADSAVRRGAIRDNFRSHYVSQLLVFFYPRLTLAKLAGLVTFEGLWHLDAALSRGHGAVLVQAHLGPEQLALVALALRGHRVMQIGCVNDAGLSPVGRGVSLRLRRRYEAGMPGKMLDARGNLMPAFRLLRVNGLVLCAGDGAGWDDRLGEHVPVNLCGQTVLFPTGAARMAVGCDAPLLPIFVTRGGATPFLITIEAPIMSGTPASMVRAFAQRYARHLVKNPGWMRFLELFEPGALIRPDAFGQAPDGRPQVLPGPSSPS